MTSVTVKFPFTVHLEDYHEGHYVAKMLGKLVGKQVSYEEMGAEFYEESAPAGYKFVFDVVQPTLAEEFSEFSKAKEAFIAP